MVLFASNLFLRKIISLNGDLFYLAAFQSKYRKKKNPKPLIMTQEEGEKGEEKSKAGRR